MASNGVEPERYWVRRFVGVSDVPAKFDDAETVKSEFCCRENPLPTLFRLELGFGAKGKDQFSARVFYVNRAVIIHKMRFHFLDPEAKRFGGTDYDNHDLGEGLNEQKVSCGWQNLSKATRITFVNREYHCSKPATFHFFLEMQYSNDSSNVSPVVVSTDPVLNRDFAKLLETGNHADVTFSLQGEEIVAHKAVLSARCAYFERMFQSDVNENVSGQVEVTDISLEVFKELLQFLYSGQPPKFAGQETLQLLSAADKYGAETLKKMCESIICANLNSDIAVEALLLAKDINCVQLKNDATNFLKVNFACLSD